MMPAFTDARPTDPVKRIMAERLVTIDGGESVRSVAQEVVADEIGVVLVEPAGGPIGLISERDVVTVVATGGDLDNDQAADIMTADLITAEPDDSIASVARLMLEAGVRHVVLRRAEEAVVGLVSIRDVLAVMVGDGDEA